MRSVKPQGTAGDFMSSTTDQKETYSPGLEGVIAGETAISTLAQGLSYRGYGIEELTAKSNYEEVAYLVLYGELPTAKQAAQLHEQLMTAMKIPAEIVEALRKIPRGANSMDVLRSATSLLAHWEPEVDDNSHDANVRKAIRLLAQMPVAMQGRAIGLLSAVAFGGDPPDCNANEAALDGEAEKGQKGGHSECPLFPSTGRRTGESASRLFLGFAARLRG